MVHLFDYPYEEDAAPIDTLFKTYGKVKGIRHQKYISREDIFTGTRLIDIVIERTPPRLVSINGYICRVWYKGQPIICNSCGAQGHKANDCPDKDKCHRCGETGHIARHCTNAWGTRPANVQDPPSAGPSNGADPDVGADCNATHDPPAQGPSVSEPDPVPGSSSADGVGDAIQDPPTQGASLSEAELDPGSFPSGDVNNDANSLITPGSEPESDLGPSPSVSASASVGNDSPELVIEEFSSTQSSSQSISDFSSESQSILKPVEVDNVNKSNVNNDGNENINNSVSNKQSINFEKTIITSNSKSMNENINLEIDSSVSSVQNSGVSKTAQKGVSKTAQKGDPNAPLNSGKGCGSKSGVAPRPRNPDKPLPKKSGLNSVDVIEDSAMDTSGGTRKRKPTDEKDPADVGSSLPQRLSRSVKRIVTPGRHSGLPMVSPLRPKKV